MSLSANRENIPVPAAGLDATCRTAAADGQPAKPRAAKVRGSAVYNWSFFLHKWIGLFAAVWLAVLGLTGFFLDHDSWRWLQQAEAPSWLTTNWLLENTRWSVARLMQVDPADPSIRVTGGPRGLWFSRDAGASWQPAAFPGGIQTQVLAIEPDPALGWKRLWFATDDGVYLSEDSGASVRPASLSGEYVTSLAAGAAPDEMISVIDRSQVFRFTTADPAKITRIALAPPAPEAHPAWVGFNRFMRDLHFGKGVFDPLSSLVMNDIGGIAMLILPLTGLLYWALPKWWRYRLRRTARRGTSKATKKATIRWLFRVHSATLGIVSVLMMIYLSVSGIFVEHGRELGAWMRSIHVPQSYLPRIYGMPSWDGWVEAIVAYPGKPDRFTIGNRIGLFTTDDGGQTWSLENGADGRPLQSAGRLRRLGDRVLIPNGMAGPSLIRDAALATREVADGGGGHRGHGRHGGDGAGSGAGDGSHGRHSADNAAPSEEQPRARHGGNPMAQLAGLDDMVNMFMPTDVTPMGDKLAWKTTDKLFVTDANGTAIEKIKIKLPEVQGVNWFTWFLRVHMGTIFWSEWRWVNDVFSVAAVLLSITGLIRWWRKKWA